jgi:hypothetical protein
MQCNFLHTDTKDGSIEYWCRTKPEGFVPTDKDKSDYCIGENFLHCPRFKVIELLSSD